MGGIRLFGQSGLGRRALIGPLMIGVAACSGSSAPHVGSAIANSPTTTTSPSVSTAAPATTVPATTTSCVVNSLLVNCSFESPVVAVGGYQLFAVDGDVSGWTVIGAPGNVAPLSEAFADAGFVWSAQDGKQTLDLTGLSNTLTGVSQVVPTTPGTTYSLSFWVGNIVNPGGGYGTSTSVNVLVDGTQVLEAVNTDGAGAKSPAYKQFTVSLTATSSSTTVGFVNADPSTDNSSIIDNITLVAAP